MIYLALIAVVEAVVYQRRYRSATHGGPLEAAWWALCTCVLRFAAPLLGVSEFFRGGDPVLLTAVYAVPAALATWAMRWWELRRTRAMLRRVWGEPITSLADDLSVMRARVYDNWGMDGQEAKMRVRVIDPPVGDRVTFTTFLADQEKADAEKHSASRIGPTNTEGGA